LRLVVPRAFPDNYPAGTGVQAVTGNRFNNPRRGYLPAVRSGWLNQVGFNKYTVTPLYGSLSPMPLSAVASAVFKSFPVLVMETLAIAINNLPLLFYSCLPVLLPKLRCSYQVSVNPEH